MKTWQVLLVGGLVLIGAVMLMKAASPKAAPVNSAFGTPASAANGLAAGIGGFLGGLASKQSSSPVVVPNEGTYYGGTSVISGNTLEDPNTGKTLVYGTD